VDGISRLPGGEMVVRSRHLLGYHVACVTIACLAFACSSPKPPERIASTPEQVATASNAHAQLWGNITPVVSVKELMRDMIDPASDFIFEAVATTVKKNEIIERMPKTDEDWAKIRIGAVNMAEGAYLLKVRRPFAPAGDENNSVGPGASELSPAQILAKVQNDPVEWNARIEALRNVGLEVMDIVKRRDVKELWDAAENLDGACENCHKSYWYPREDAKFYEKLDRKLRELPMPQLRPDRTR
jgi:hypothetical protein